MNKPKKSLGQHWLTDDTILRQIVDYANLESSDTVLEIGPGLGTLTKVLSEKAGEVVAIEFDRELAENLPGQISAENLKIVNADFLQFDLNVLPKNYKVVANVPYYITAKIVQKLLTAKNRPREIVLLVQKEVAERLAAKPGNLSILAISAQLFAEVNLGIVVKSEFFTPPPKVDSQVVIMKIRNEPLFANLNEKLFFRVVKAGFSARRKKLRTSLAGGLNLSKTEAENLLQKAEIDPNLRAQDLSLDDWADLTSVCAKDL